MKQGIRVTMSRGSKAHLGLGVRILRSYACVRIDCLAFMESTWAAYPYDRVVHREALIGTPRQVVFQYH